MTRGRDAAWLAGVLAVCAASALWMHRPAQTSPPEPQGKITIIHADVGRITRSREDIKITDLVSGGGPEAEVGSTVLIRYTGWLDDGDEFERSGNHTLTLCLGEGTLPWEDAITGMRVRGKRRLDMPVTTADPKHAIDPTLPPDTMVAFEVDLLGAQVQVPGQPATGSTDTTILRVRQPGHQPTR